MEIQTLADTLAWVDRLRTLGREDGPYDPQELSQVLRVHQQEIAALQRHQTVTDMELVRVKAQLAALEATQLDQEDFDAFVQTVMVDRETLQAADPAGPA